MTEPRDRPVPLLERFERFLDTVIPPPDDVALGVRRGEALLAAGDAPGAERIAQNALAVVPVYLRALVLRADALAAQGRVLEALTVLDDAARDRALPAEVIARRVEFAGRAGDARRALELEPAARERARGNDPATARRLLVGARALIDAGAHAAGLRLARGATMVDPALGAAWLVLADDAQRRGDAVQARRALDRALPVLDAGDAPANRLAGELLLAIGDLVLAARHLRRAWIVGDEAAVAPLVLALSRAGDVAGLERVVADAEGELARVARALVALGQGDPHAHELLSKVNGTELPDALWPLGLDVTLRAAPDIAERWAREAASRPGAAATLALADARARLAQGDPAGARAALGAALDDPRTAPRARDVYRDACRAGWRARLDVLLDELAAMLRESPVLGSLETELRTRRRELDDPLRVAILGEFSAGKSTFLNALVGANVSPMGVLPTTAQVHWLRFGDPGARIVDSRGGAVVASIGEAPRVVEKKRAEGVAVDYVEVTMPAARLARVELIDTPGFNAGDAAHETAVRRAFDIADLALWLFDARQAGKQSETGPLNEAREHALPVIGFLNKIDQVREVDRERLLAVVREGFRDLAPLALAFSAREGLAATLVLGDEASDEAQRDAARTRLERSGLPGFLAYLDEHLVAQRAAWKQLRIARRARDLVTTAQDALARDATDRTARQERVAGLVTQLGALRRQLWETSGAVRREVGAVFREQMRGLESRRRRDERGADDAQALATDAAAEIGFRARARALEQLAVPLREIERLAVEAGLVVPEAASIVTAPVTLLLDQAVAEGIRDATTGAGGPVFVPSDPVAALEQALARRDDDAGESHELLRIALEVAREELDGYAPPPLPGPG